jgi:hypothetical protein
LLTLRRPHNNAWDRSAELSASNAIYAITKQGEAIVIFLVGWADDVGAAMLIGAVAGLRRALRAARMQSTEALWSV